jgi:hypothetical protein
VYNYVQKTKKERKKYSINTIAIVKIAGQLEEKAINKNVMVKGDEQWSFGRTSVYGGAKCEQETLSHE